MGLLFKLLLSFYRKAIPTGFWRMSPSGTILLVKFSYIDVSQVRAGLFFRWSSGITVIFTRKIQINIHP